MGSSLTSYIMLVADIKDILKVWWRSVKLINEMCLQFICAISSELSPTISKIVTFKFSWIWWHSHQYDDMHTHIVDIFILKPGKLLIDFLLKIMLTDLGRLLVRMSVCHPHKYVFINKLQKDQSQYMLKSSFVDGKRLVIFFWTGSVSFQRCFMLN